MTQMLQPDESTGAKEPAPGRRTQAERRASSRTKILDAAVDCLMTEGYAATTTLRVQARAGVNRGTLLHYFPTRATLLVAAIDHMYAARRQQMYELLLRLPTGGSRIDSAIDILWETACSPLVMTSIQLWTASVNDAELAEALRAHHSVLRRDRRTVRRTVRAGAGRASALPRRTRPAAARRPRRGRRPQLGRARPHPHGAAGMEDARAHPARGPGLMPTRDGTGHVGSATIGSASGVRAARLDLSGPGGTFPATHLWSDTSRS